MFKTSLVPFGTNRKAGERSMADVRVKTYLGCDYCDFIIADPVVVIVSICVS